MALVDLNFLWVFGVTFVGTILLAVSGGVLGMGLANVFKTSCWTNIALAFWLRLFSWVPFVLFYSLPSRPDNIVFMAFISGAVAVGVHTSSCLQSLWSVNLKERGDFNYLVARSTILQALLFCLFIQIRSHTGWVQLFLQQLEPGMIFSAMTILAIFVFLLDRLSKYDFDDDVSKYRAVIKAEREINKFFSLLILVSIGIVYFVISLVMGEHLKKTTSPNLGVASWFVYLLRGDSLADTIWKDLFISNVEVWTGLLVSCGLALYAGKIRSNKLCINRSIVRVVAAISVIAIILPMLLPFFGINRAGQFSLSTIISISVLTLFPFLRVIKALQGEHRLMAMMVGFKITLPLAYVGMFIGELYGAVAGLGFRIMSELASGQPVAAMAVSFIALITLLISIFILHWASVLDHHELALV
jgi:ABC-type nitrate/sulfonate/bicarbonate transport system permease component